MKSCFYYVWCFNFVRLLLNRFYEMKKTGGKTKVHCVHTHVCILCTYIDVCGLSCNHNDMSTGNLPKASYYHIGLMVKYMYNYVYPYRKKYDTFMIVNV